jgi:hypothetical protein
MTKDQFIIKFAPYHDNILEWLDKHYTDFDLEFDLNHFDPKEMDISTALILDRSIKSYMQMKGAVL